MSKKLAEFMVMSVNDFVFGLWDRLGVMKNIFSVSQMTETLLFSVKRFPVTVLFAVGWGRADDLANFA